MHHLLNQLDTPEKISINSYVNQIKYTKIDFLLEFPTGPLKGLS